VLVLPTVALAVPWLTELHRTVHRLSTSAVKSLCHNKKIEGCPNELVCKL